MVRRILVLAGAPESRTLNWEESNLLGQFLDPIATFARIDAAASEPALGPALDVAVWRSIPLTRTALPTGFSQIHHIREDDFGDERFFNSAGSSFDAASGCSGSSAATQEILDRFYDHSLAVHDDIPSSELPTASCGTTLSSFDTTGDQSSHMSIQSNDLSIGQDQPSVAQSAHLSDLEDVPNASYLESISPQTMTVNLIVGIISIAEPRTVKTRWGSTLSLIELLVGDETKSGFSVTFWLSSDLGESSSKILRELRRQDIVLLRNVALSVFMNKVHGHSLRKGLTKVDLLHRRRLDRSDRGGLYNLKDVSSKKSAHPQLRKTRRVREWVMNFVGGGGTALGKRRRGGKSVRSWDMPPEDSQ
ncbi:hypothetical protein GGS23DRAFT_555912 [Durotheca rogersii]|uniref:uncharacterized protein n=1 Tax=Durotheca rogersii TaxID=419775 RepID=UPI00221F0732|nr:uncharacterized protein GGS23DRAFT_555912 [Durotheca rogersii]KAI5866189.1 hypothetical protein GGS23DRAFT_555912 [Durotheca rogersii]